MSQTDTRHKKVFSTAKKHDTTALIENETFEFDQQGSGLRDLTLIQKLWPFVRPHKKGLIVSILLLPVVTGTQILQPIIVKQAIDGPITEGNLIGLGHYCGLFLALLAFHYWIRYIQLDLSQVVGQQIVKDIRESLYQHVQSLSLRFFHVHPVGKLVTRVTSDVENLSEMLSSGGVAILTDIALIIGAVVGMLMLDVRLAGFGVLMLVVALVVMELFRRKARVAYDLIRVKTARINAFLQENITGMEVVQLYRREAHNFRGFESLNHDLYKSGMDAAMVHLSFNAIVELLTYLTIVLVLWYSGNAILDERMTFGVLVAFLQYVHFMFEPVENVSEKVSIIQSGLASIDKVMILFNEQADIQTTTGKTPGQKEGRVAFNHVTFGYLPDKPVLKDVSFTAKPGQMLAFVGPSGAGKTTLFKLLARFYDVNDGNIRVDELDVRDWDVKALRKTMIAIQQDDVIFSRSVAENIAMHPEEIDRKAVNRAIDTVHARAIIDRLPEGIDTVLGEQGGSLSSGEKQLLLFARAVYHNPRILLLDEATAAVDPHTEHLVQRAMETLMQGRTVLMIAHRLSTIQRADCILVLENGRIIESGNHAALLAQNGMYARFYNYQQALQQA